MKSSTKPILMVAVAMSMLTGVVGTAGVASAQPDQNRRDTRTVVKNRTVVKLGGARGWRAGGRIERGDWNRGRLIDYRAYRLSAPPSGYEWREVDGNYVLAAAATGVIASVLLAGQ